MILCVLAILSHKLGKKIKNFDKILDQFKDLHTRLETAVENQSLRSSIGEEEFSNERQNLHNQCESLMSDLEIFRSMLC